MAVRTSWSAGQVLTAADLTDTFAAKAPTASPTFTGSPSVSGSNPQLNFLDTDNNADALINANNGNLLLSADANNEAASSVCQVNVDGTKRLAVSPDGIESYQSSNALTFNFSAANENAVSPVACIGFNVTSSGETAANKAAIGLERNGAQGVGRLRIMVNGGNNSTQVGTADTMMSFQAGTGVFSSGIYNSTSSAGANVFIETAAGSDQTIIKRSTSSARYKTDIETLQDEYADRVLELRPVWFRSTCEGDVSLHPNWSYYGLIAEEVAEVDPRMVHWGGEDPDNPLPESVQYDRLVPHLISVIKRQQAQIDALTARLDAAGL